ncbi:hypothetical protein CcCBS67573_g06822 [Chytriomyces confervae]|uniref:Adenosine deaminase domain-containing protein n=1 Tax=Chytriomyces confervae TaxID=246404 RepID=A0A507EZV7_9FUNG|nr:hypothetical protein CcCBS67573_g06822 [Chytriomyces confervae]
MDELTWAKNLAKTELHAHINGSIGMPDLRKLADLKGVHLPAEIALPGSAGFSLDDVFALFSKTIYSVVRDAQALQFVVEHVVAAFKRDGVRYLELRSTPKSLEGMDMDGYVSTVVSAISKAMSENETIRVKFLLSVDRRHDPETASTIVSLAIKYANLFPSIVVGVDVCGNPACGGIKHLVPSLSRLKLDAPTLKLVIHFAEIETPPEEDELLTILSLNPDRLGHCTFVPDHIMATMRARKIPIEICLSSNVVGGTVNSFEAHHLKQLWDSGYPRECLILCTDDVGIFCSDLSNEYVIARRVLGVSREVMEEWAQLVCDKYAR